MTEILYRASLLGDTLSIAVRGDENEWEKPQFVSLKISTIENGGLIRFYEVFGASLKKAVVTAQDRVPGPFDVLSVFDERGNTQRIYFPPEAVVRTVAEDPSSVSYIAVLRGSVLMVKDCDDDEDYESDFLHLMTISEVDSAVNSCRIFENPMAARVGMLSAGTLVFSGRDFSECLRSARRFLVIGEVQQGLPPSPRVKKTWVRKPRAQKACNPPPNDLWKMTYDRDSQTPEVGR